MRWRPWMSSCVEDAHSLGFRLSAFGFRLEPQSSRGDRGPVAPVECRKSKAESLALEGRARDVQPAIDNFKSLAELRFGNAERRIAREAAPADEGEEAVVAEEA